MCQFCTLLRQVLKVQGSANTQATKFTPEHVDERIEAFFKNFIANELTEERVAEAVAALVKQKLRADVTLEEEVDKVSSLHLST